MTGLQWTDAPAVAWSPRHGYVRLTASTPQTAAQLAALQLAEWERRSA